MFFSKISNFYKKTIENIQNFVPNLIPDQILLNIVFLFSKTVVTFDKYKILLFKKFPFFQKWEEKTMKIMKILYSKYKKTKCEPFYDDWISISNLIVYDAFYRNSDETNLAFKYNFEEKYEKLDINSIEDFVESNEKIIYPFLDFNLLGIKSFRIEDAQSNRSNPFISAPKRGTLNENWSKTIKENPYLDECLVCVKFNNRYNSFVINNSKLYSRFNQFNNKECSNPFLTIEYYHKMMENTIPIDLHKGFFLMKNEILSKAFIFRYLEYQSLPFYFDYDYEIRIIDKDLNSIVLKSDDYIFLNCFGYEIVHNNNKNK